MSLHNNEGRFIRATLSSLTWKTGSGARAPEPTNHRVDPGYYVECYGANHGENHGHYHNKIHFVGETHQPVEHLSPHELALLP